MKRTIIWIAVAVVLLAAAYTVFQRVSRRAIRETASEAVPVLLAHPSRGAVERGISYSGTLEPREIVTLTPKTSGRIERISVKEGDTVKRGQVLVLMEGDVARLQLDQASSALQAAQAQYDKARKGARSGELDNARALLDQAEKDFGTAGENYDRSRRLFDEGTISKAGYEEADKKFSTARTQVDNARRSVRMMEEGATSEELALAAANVRAAKAQADLAQLQLDNTRITSPASGRVAKVFIDSGNMAGVSTPLLAIMADDSMIVKIAVPETHYGEFRRNEKKIPARVRLTALPSLGEIPGSISSIAAVIDPASRTFTVEVELSNPEGNLRAGMYANVWFTLEAASNALLVPAAALVTRGEKMGVFAVRSSSRPAAAFTPITIGVANEESVQVLSGLSESDAVVVEGNAFLEDGQAVAPREAP